MDVFMIGNGFDLHYFLPTTYSCFLRVAKNISGRLASGETITSVSQVLGDPILYNSDSCLQRCYYEYKNGYDASLEPGKVNKYFGMIAQNEWFSYLLNSLEAGKGWIDFEREIGKVIRTLSYTLSTVEIGNNTKHLHFLIYLDDRYTEHICTCFSFFFDRSAKKLVTCNGKQAVSYLLAEEYVVEEPFGSSRYIVNVEKFVSTLYSKLRSLANSLAAYLTMFVDLPVKKLAAAGKIHLDNQLISWQWENATVVSFNYTHTMSVLYDFYEKIHYIHGSLDEQEETRIVLGVDSDESDISGSIDVTFIQFKKYFQRIFYYTDLSYISFVDEIEQANGGIVPFNLYVIGHSLDKTDKEVIQDLFMRAARIIIYYHNQNAVSDYIRNLVSVFGKKQFDLFRAKKKMRFLPLESLDNKKHILPMAWRDSQQPHTAKGSCS